MNKLNSNLVAKNHEEKMELVIEQSEPINETYRIMKNMQA